MTPSPFDNFLTYKPTVGKRLDYSYPVIWFCLRYRPTIMLHELDRLASTPISIMVLYISVLCKEKEYKWYMKEALETCMCITVHSFAQFWWVSRYAFELASSILIYIKLCYNMYLINYCFQLVLFWWVILSTQFGLQSLIWESKIEGSCNSLSCHVWFANCNCNRNRIPSSTSPFHQADI